MKRAKEEELDLDPRWDDLYRRCRGDLYRAALYLVGAGEAEEVVQDAFERGIREQAFFETISEPQAWLHAVTVRLAVSRLRRRAVWERIRSRVTTPPSNNLPDAELHDALHRLSPNQRGALILRYFFGADYREIAHALRMSEASIGQVLTRARAALRKELT